MGKKKQETKEKPLEKMTATELREVTKEMPEIVGAHGMNKGELVSAIKKARGIEEVSKKKSDTSIRDIKKKIKKLKTKGQEALKAKNKKMAVIYRHRISRLKKKTRRVA